MLCPLPVSLFLLPSLPADQVLLPPGRLPDPSPGRGPTFVPVGFSVYPVPAWLMQSQRWQLAFIAFASLA